MNVNILFFLKENGHWLVKPPINGSLTAIHSLFLSKYPNELSWEQFQQSLQELKFIDPYALEYDTFDTETPVLFINEINLSLLVDKLVSSSASSSSPSQVNNNGKANFKGRSNKQRARKQKKDVKTISGTAATATPTATPTSTIQQQNPGEMLNQLQDLLSNVEPPKLTHLRELLKYESTGHQLTLERMSKTTTKTPFLETCNDNNHSQFLAFNSDPSKFPKDLFHCISHKIHFIPIIKQHTDTSLGDCSYLDTCHKLDSCRYLHYKKHIPYSALDRSIQDCESFNQEIPYYEMIAPWCRNGSTSNLSRDVLPPQWINCDVRTFDFNIVGKFAAVIADPAWNIHMNLPYGTCNDTELLNLPLHTVQDEGVLMLWVTGRAIEIGKASLSKWGYKIMNEMVWIKTNQLGRTICTGRTGHWLNHSKEHLLVGVKGQPEWLDKLVDLDFMVSATRETSRKPDELYGMVERLVGPHARKLEIFGRDHNTRPGWFTIGNQLNGTQIHECDVLKRFEEKKV